MKPLPAGLTLLGILVLLPWGEAFCQAPGKDPMQKIKELFQKAEKAMDKIDDALLGADPARAGDPSKVKAALQAALKNQGVVKKTIEEILKNLPPSPNGGGGGSCNKPSSQPKNQPRQGNRPRKRDKKPDLVRQKKKPSGAGKKQGGKKQENKGKSKPANPRNRKGKRPPKNPAGKKQPQGGSETWGNLPLFLRDVFREEQAPKLPAKYLPFWKAFLKRGREKR